MSPARRRTPDWYRQISDQLPEFESRLSRLSGGPARIGCSRDGKDLVVEIAAATPSQAEAAADELSTLWPSLLAPAGVGLDLIGYAAWDHEAMALRSFTRR